MRICLDFLPRTGWATAVAQDLHASTASPSADTGALAGTKWLWPRGCGPERVGVLKGLHERAL